MFLIVPCNKNAFILHSAGLLSPSKWNWHEWLLLKQKKGHCRTSQGPQTDDTSRRANDKLLSIE